MTVNNRIDERLLEIHGPGMWNMLYVERAIKLAKECDATGIIFHCNELVDRVVLPTSVFTADEVFAFLPMRLCHVNNDADYLRTVLERCKKNGLKFYAEVKEFSFDNHLIHKFPEIIGTNGKICATHPILFDYLEKKYDEFFALFPEVAGVIVSVGTIESRVSITANQCHCERCTNYDKDKWFKDIIKRLYDVHLKYGKQLVIRDFAYNKENQFAMVNAVNSISDKIIMSVKKAPHDYYPVSVDNPAVGRTQNQWVEFDTWGQFFGLGVFPASIVEDIHARLRRFIAKGIKGIMIRLDWENMSEASVFNSFNIVNSIGAAMIAADIDIDDKEIYAKWCKWGLASPLISDSFLQGGTEITDPADIEFFSHIVKEGYDIIRKTLYAKKNLFAINSKCFDRVQYAHYFPLIRHNREEWEPGVTDIMKPTDENIAILRDEKAEALEQAERLGTYIRSRKPSVKPWIQEYLDFIADYFPLYVKGFAVELISYLYTRSIEEGNTGNLEKLVESLEDFDSLAGRYDDVYTNKGYNHEILYMFDGNNLRDYKKTVEAKMKEF